MLDDSALDVTIAGDLAYVATAGAGLSVVDVAAPDSLTLVATCPLPSNAVSVAVDGNYACVAAGESGMHVVSVEDPLAPFVLGALDTPGTATDVALTGNYAYLVDAPSVVRVISIDFPSDPRTIGTCVTQGYISDVELAGDHVYAVGTHGLHAIEIADVVAPPLLACAYDTPGRARGVTVEGDYAYVGDRREGFRIFDISDPEDVTLAGFCDVAEYSWQAAIAGDHAFLACEHEGIASIDISDPSDPTLLGFCDTPGTARHCEVEGNYVYVSDHVALQVVDVSDPANPMLAGSCPPVSGQIRGVAIAGDYAYVNEAPFHLMVVDISDPENPWVAGRCEISGTPSLYGVAVAGNYVFWAGTGTIVVIDVTDPTSPTIAGECHLTGTPREFAVSGNQLFVANTQAGFSVVDITDPPNPVLLGSYATEWQARGLDVAGDYAYVGVYESGFYVFKVYERYDHAADTGQSLPVDDLDDDFVRFRFSTSQVDSITWELSMDGGAGWAAQEPDWLWTVAPSLGSDLLWRSTHTYTGRGLNPACTSLDLNWLYRFPVIDSVIDVPNDQGGRVRLHLTRSGYDFTEESDTPIVTYNVLRRVDDLATRQALLETRSEFRMAGAENTGFAHGTELAGRRFVTGGAFAGRGELPPGVWEVLGSFAALQEPEYICLAETLADSSDGGLPHSVYCVTAHTAEPSVWHCSYPDSGYSVDNIAPGVPTGLAVSYTFTHGNELAWDSCPDGDFQYFRVYCGEGEDFVPGPENLVHMTTETEWTDPAGTGWDHYKITALDHVGNESDPAAPETVTGAEEVPTASSFALYQSSPHPASRVTTIRFDVPSEGGKVTLEIFDLAGRRVRTLVDRHMTAGRQAVKWDGLDTDGTRVASGVYYCRFRAPGYERTFRLTILR